MRPHVQPDDDEELGNQRECQREAPAKSFEAHTSLASPLRKRPIAGELASMSMGDDPLQSHDQKRREVVLQVAERSRQRALLKLAVAAAKETELAAQKARDAAVA